MENNFLDWLIRVYGDKLVLCSTANGGKIFVVNYKGNHIRFVHDNKDKIMISIDKKSEDLLNDFIGNINEYLGCLPLCSYNVMFNENGEKTILSSIEWRKTGINERLFDIYNLRNVDSSAFIFNIKVFDYDNLAKFKVKKKSKISKFEDFWYNV